MDKEEIEKEQPQAPGEDSAPAAETASTNAPLKDSRSGSSSSASSSTSSSLSSSSSSVSSDTPPRRDSAPIKRDLPRENDYDWGKTLGEGSFGTVRCLSSLMNEQSDFDLGIFDFPS